MHIAIDGISLKASPGEAASLHLNEILEALNDVAEAPLVTLFISGALAPSLPGNVTKVEFGAITSDWQRLRIEQRRIPKFVSELDRAILLSMGGGVAFGSRSPVVSLEPVEPEPPGAGIAGRLRWSLGEAGRRGASLRLAYADLGLQRTGTLPLSPFVSKLFRATPGERDSQSRKAYALPGDYVLSMGLGRDEADELLAAWTWVEGSVGDAIPLVILGVEPTESRRIRELADSYGVGSAIRLLPSFEFEDLPGIYRGASAFLHLGRTRYGQELRWALATGVPVAAVENHTTDAILGKAGYLAPPDDSRALGAACLTLLVEAESVAEALKRQGLERAVAFHTSTFASDLIKSLQDLNARGQGDKSPNLADDNAAGGTA